MYPVFESLVSAANQYPDKVAVIDEYGELSYSDLRHQVIELSERLRDLGVVDKSFVGLHTRNNREFIIGLYAISSLGAVAMPIFHKQKEREVLQAIEEAELQFVLNDRALKLPAIESELSEANESFELHRLNDSGTPLDDFTSPAFVRFTSGTTGKAKGVVISHQAVIERIEAANRVLQIDSEDCILWVFPMAYHFIVSIVLYFHRGATVVINNDFLAQEIIASIQKHEVTFFYCAPMHLKLLAAVQEKPSIPSLQRVISTTTGASSSVCRDFSEKYGLTVEQAFGIIEVGLPIINTMDSDKHPDAVGQALRDYEVLILDQDRKELPDGEVGLLGVKGPGMFDGYLKSPLPKSALLVNGFFMTGDLAVRDQSGTITIKGREKNVIIVHGNKVFPTEVEDVINRYPGIRQSRVFGQMHPLFGEVVMAEVVCEAEVDSAGLLRYCRQYLSAYKLPQKILRVEQIEMTASGKVKRLVRFD